MRRGDVLVAVIAGGDTDEAEASLASAEHVFDVLRSRFACVLLRLDHGMWSALRYAPDEQTLELDVGAALPLRFRDPATGSRVTPSVAVLCTHGFPGETGELQGLLAIAGIPYCSSGVLASALAADKFRCSQYLAALCGTPIPRQRLLNASEVAAGPQSCPQWRPPFILKPNTLGSSLGVLSAHDERAMAAAFSKAAARGGDHLIQEFIDGVEITAGAIRLGGRVVQLPPAAVWRSRPPDESGIRSFTDHRSVHLDIPADLPARVTAEVGEQMRRIGDTLALRGPYRADFIWAAGRLFFLEVNTVPGLSRSSVFTRLLAAANLDLGDVLDSLIAESVAWRGFTLHDGGDR